VLSAGKWHYLFVLRSDLSFRDRLSSRWGDFRLEAYLDDHDQKEYHYYED